MITAKLHVLDRREFLDDGDQRFDAFVVDLEIWSVWCWWWWLNSVRVTVRVGIGVRVA
jgi:hypothetical protein